MLAKIEPYLYKNTEEEVAFLKSATATVLTYVAVHSMTAAGFPILMQILPAVPLAVYLAQQHKKLEKGCDQMSITKGFFAGMIAHAVTGVAASFTVAALGAAPVEDVDQISALGMSAPAYEAAADAAPLPPMVGAFR